MLPTKVIDEIIREAMERGEFDDLPGRGKPIDLSAYFNTPEDVRLAYSVLKNAGVLPEEIESLKTIEMLKSELETCKEEKRRSEINKVINRLTLNFNILIDQHRHRNRNNYMITLTNIPFPAILTEYKLDFTCPFFGQFIKNE